jgi:DNA-3-methyladenine glycosylase II
MNWPTHVDYFKSVDPLMATLIETFEPFPQEPNLTKDTLLSALAKAIFFQSISIQSASTVYSRFLKLYPDQAFPPALELLNTTDETLRQVGLPFAKIRYLKGVAEKVLDGLPSLEELAAMDDDAIIHLLTSLRGIGRWSAQMVLIFQLRRLDVLPADDLGVRAGIRDLYSLQELPSKAAVEKMGDRWRPYRTLATWSLWLSRGDAARALLKSWTQYD